jgi:hypothetical protein
MRRRPRTRELAFYRCYSPTPVPLAEPVRVAGSRWTVKETFQGGKGLTGLDQHQVRRWVPWRRRTLIAMLAHALLAVLAAAECTQHPAPPGVDRADLHRDLSSVQPADHRPRPPRPGSLTWTN